MLGQYFPSANFCVQNHVPGAFVLSRMSPCAGQRGGAVGAGTFNAAPFVVA